MTAVCLPHYRQRFGKHRSGQSREASEKSLHPEEQVETSGKTEELFQVPGKEQEQIGPEDEDDQISKQVLILGATVAVAAGIGSSSFFSSRHKCMLIPLVVIVYGLVRCSHLTFQFLFAVRHVVSKAGFLAVVGYANACLGMKLTMQFLMFYCNERTDCFKDFELWFRGYFGNDLSKVYFVLATVFPVVLDFFQFLFIQVSLSMVTKSNYKPTIGELFSINKSGILADTKLNHAKKCWLVYALGLSCFVLIICFLGKSEYENVVERTYSIDGARGLPTAAKFMIFKKELSENVIGASEGFIQSKDQYIDVHAVCRSEVYVKRGSQDGSGYSYVLTTSTGSELKPQDVTDSSKWNSIVCK